MRNYHSERGLSPLTTLEDYHSDRGLSFITTLGDYQSDRGLSLLTSLGDYHSDRGLSPITTLGDYHSDRGLSPLSTLGDYHRPLSSALASPTTPESFVMVYLTMLGPDRLIFLESMASHFLASAREAYKSLACRTLCIIMLLLLWRDTGPAGWILGNIGALQKY